MNANDLILTLSEMRGDVLKADNFTEVSLYFPYQAWLEFIVSSGGKVVQMGLLEGDVEGAEAYTEAYFDGRTEDMPRLETILSVPQSWVVTESDIDACQTVFNVNVIETELEITLTPKFVIPWTFPVLFYEIETERGHACDFALIHQNIHAGNENNKDYIQEVLKKLQHQGAENGTDQGRH